MIMFSLSALNKPNLLWISPTQSARTFKENPFLCFQFQDFKAFTFPVNFAKIFKIFKFTFSVNFAKIFKNTFFLRTSPVAAFI